MTITMTAKNQVTIPKKITNVLGLTQGAMFNVVISNNKIELIPLEVREKTFTDEMYKKLNALADREKGKEKKVSKRFVDALRKSAK
ncbi:MAG TPA: AbrB/MazE/SpoVT family DNA-binding domain-containing protein [Candidatus Omnitrophota bacterium]|nr:AbrB/MazE/SpoVT family DNA-binding domain-containing protein [Candidatus Omnitrophota bacterium]